MMIGRAVIEDRLTTGRWRAYRDGQEILPSALVIGTNSIDVSLGRKFIKTRQRSQRGAIDPYEPGSMECYDIEEDYLVLPPGGTILGHTRERFDLQNDTYTVGDQQYGIAPMYDGRSTCGRLFLASHITAGYGDVGFSSSWTLELKNMSECNALIVHAGMRIGQVSFHLIAGPIGVPYQGAYVQQHDSPKAPVLGRERF